VAIISWYDIFLLITKRGKRVRIEGNSMLPELKEGDEVLVKQTNTYKVGEIVLAIHPFKTSVKIIKRIDQISEAGEFFLLGDNPNESTDSRTLGLFSQLQLLGKVTKKLK
jgi:nickel-type superoxide dismutase maturation protease